jgi:hypothetical protein
MAQDADLALTSTKQSPAAAPIEARKAAIQAARQRMAGNLDELEHRVGTALGVRDHDATASPGQRRSATAITALVTARRLWRLPFWRLTSIGAATVVLVGFAAWRSRR